MKKIIAAILAAVLMLGCLAMTALATDTVKPEDADVQFSIKGASGQPGDEVEVTVNLDKNPGTWCAKFEVHFDDTYFQLISVENGKVFNDSEFLKSILNDKGCYTYYAEGKDPTTDNKNTGVILTLKFQILNNAVNGEHDVSLVFPDNGYGWFFSAKDLDHDYTVGATNSAFISVDGSTATADPNGTTAADSTTGTSSGATNYVTDDKGAPATDANGNYETYKVNPGEPVVGYVTDDSGSFVTDDKGAYETYVIDENTTGENQTTETQNDTTAADKSTQNVTLKKIVIIACIAAIVVAAVILIVVLTSKKNGSGNDGDGDNGNTDTSAAPKAPEVPETPKADLPEAEKTEEDSPADTDDNHKDAE